MAATFNVIFRGDIAPGFTVDQVKTSFEQLFRLTPEKASQLFAGRPVVLKKNLDQTQAEQFRQRLATVGAIIQIREVESEIEQSEAAPEATPAVQPSPTEQTISIAPVGADVLKEDEVSRPDPVQVTTEHLSVDVPGADVLRPEERKPEEKLEIDLSHLSINPP
jgi:hypothetical protein